MRITVILLFITFAISCNNSQNKSENEKTYSSFYVGTYTDSGSQGIYKYSIDDSGVLHYNSLAAQTSNPSFVSLTSDSKYLVSVSENATANNSGSIKSYVIKGDSLVLLSEQSSGGAHPCFVAINNDGYVVVANYTGGNISLFKINKNGELSEMLDLQQHTGKGTTDRQEAPHAHSAWFAPNGETVIAVDLGTNELWFYALDKVNQKLIPQKQAKLAMTDGAGPRHLDFHPNKKWIYVMNELNATVSLVTENQDGTYEVISSAPTLPADYTEANKCADIHISADGKFLYASNRGHNSIAVFAIDQESGKLAFVEHETEAINWPRNFSISPCGKYVVVANRFSNSLSSFSRDETSGELRFTSEIDALSPVCVQFE